MPAGAASGLELEFFLSNGKVSKEKFPSKNFLQEKFPNKDFFGNFLLGNFTSFLCPSFFSQEVSEKNASCADTGLFLKLLLGNFSSLE